MNTFSPARRVNQLDELERAGDYMLDAVEIDGEVRRRVLFLLPLHVGEHWGDRPTRGSGIHGITEPPWTFTEHPDGSVEITGSIASGRHDPEGEYFHGWLRAGNQWETIC